MDGQWDRSKPQQQQQHQEPPSPARPVEPLPDAAWRRRLLAWGGMGLFAAASGLRAQPAVKMSAAAPTTAATAAGAPPLRMVYAESLPPLAYVEGDQVRGAWVSVAEELARRLQLEVRHEAYPWARAQLMVRNGQADAMITAPSEERLRYALAGREDVLENDTRVWVNREHPRREALERLRQLAELKGYRVVSYLGNGWLRAGLPEEAVLWLRSLDDAVRLAALEPDVVLVEGERLMLPALRRRGLEAQFQPVGPVLERTRSRLMIGRRSPHAARLAEFDRALAAMRREGSLRLLLATHGLD